MLATGRTGQIEFRRILTLLVVMALTVACVVAVDASPARATTVSVGTEAELKDALVTLSSDSSGPHLVTLTADIVLVSSHAVYSGTKDLTIEGNGHFVSGNDNSRVFYFPISQGVTVTLQNLIIENGRSSGEGGYGGGVAVNAYGQGIGGDLVVINSVVRNNTAVNNDGGGIMVAYGGDLTLIDSMVLGNQAQDAGGVNATHVEVIRSTVANNLAGTSEDGGGIFGATVTLINSTVSGNTGGAGSGVYSRGPLEMVYSTVANNGNGIQVKTLTSVFGDADLTAFGSVVANPSSSNCAIAGVTTSTYSYDDDATCGFIDASDTSSGADPQLGVLANNGGPTQTRLPSAGSPLVEVIPSAACDTTYTADQRGISRPKGTHCDIGAVEVEFPNHPPVAVADPYGIDEDHSLTPSSPGVLANDWDLDGDSISAEIVSNPSHGHVDLYSDGSFEYTPHDDWWGTDSFSYRATDGALYSSPATVTIDVDPVNDAPVAHDSGEPFIIPGGVSCVDIHASLLFAAEDPDGDPMTAHLYTDATHVDMSVNPDGTWCAEPNGPWPGTDSFQWRAYDGKAYSNPATVTLTTRPFDEVADLTLTKTAGPDPVEVGELLRYTVTVRNDGPDPATQVVVTDELSPLVAFSSASDPCSHESGIVTCDIGIIVVNETVTLQITVTPIAEGQIDNFVAANLHEIDADGQVAAGVTVNATEPGAPTARVAGLDRILTAIDASVTTYLAGEAGAVVLARSDLFPDALAGSVLTVAHEAPLLLTPPTALDGRVEAEIKRVLPLGGTVFLLGGEAALSRGVEQRIESLGYDAVRLGGRNRYETAVVIASAVPDAETILVATAQDFPDALAAGAAAAAVNGVVVLTNGDTMTAETRAFIDARRNWPRYAIGGPATRADPGAMPIFGANRYETAIAVANEFFDGPVVVGIAVGTRFPDALGGAGHIGRRGGPMLLTDTTTIPAALHSYLQTNRATIERAYIYGGPAAISLDVEASIRILID